LFHALSSIITSMPGQQSFFPALMTEFRNGGGHTPICNDRTV
jgi:hypothetical protein